LCPDISDDIPESIDYKILDIRGPEQDKLQMVKKYVQDKYKGELISKQYVNNKTRLEFRCKNNHTFFQTWACISQGSFCKICSTYLPIKLAMTKKVLEFSTKHKIEMISEYQTSKIHLEFRCQVCEKIMKKTWNKLRYQKRVCCC
jgi:hypothetical protein